MLSLIVSLILACCFPANLHKKMPLLLNCLHCLETGCITAPNVRLEIYQESTYYSNMSRLTSFAAKFDNAKELEGLVPFLIYYFRCMNSNQSAVESLSECGVSQECITTVVDRLVSNTVDMDTLLWTYKQVNCWNQSYPDDNQLCSCSIGADDVVVSDGTSTSTGEYVAIEEKLCVNCINNSINNDVPVCTNTTTKAVIVDTNEHNMRLHINEVDISLTNTNLDYSSSNKWNIVLNGEVTSNVNTNLWNKLLPVSICLYSALATTFEHSDDVWVQDVDDIHHSMVIVNQSNSFKYDYLYENYQTHVRYSNGLDVTDSTHYKHYTYCIDIKMPTFAIQLASDDNSSLHYLHMWLQVASTGTKLLNSDEYVLLDLEVPIVTVPYVSHPVLSYKLGEMMAQDANQPLLVNIPHVLRELIPPQSVLTIPLSSVLIQQTIIEVFDHWSDSVPTKLPKLVVYMKWHKFDCQMMMLNVTSVLCTMSHKLFHYEINSSYVTQQVNGINVPMNKYFISSYIQEYCSSEGLNKLECMDLFIKVYQYLYKFLLLHQLFLPQSRRNIQMPTVNMSSDLLESADGMFLKVFKPYANSFIQMAPSPTDPFVFIHIDKCAGSTVRA